MRINTNTALIGDRVVLVPYREEHVERYHAWMQDPEIQELTASEPLTLEEEYAMQRSWREDDDKLTFIVLARADPSLDLRSLPMAGDVNLFFKGTRGDDDFEVEAEIMIADKSYRRQGLAREALSLLFRFATTAPKPVPSSTHASTSSAQLPIKPASLVARIGASNAASRSLFEKLGFVLTRVVEVFDEVEMRYIDGTANWEDMVIEVKAYE